MTAARSGAQGLRVVPPPRPISQAAASGTRRELLVAMRDKIAGELDTGVPARELASCTKRLLELVNEIEAIDSQALGDDIGNAAATPDEEWMAT